MREFSDGFGRGSEVQFKISFSETIDLENLWLLVEGERLPLGEVFVEVVGEGSGRQNA